MAGYYSIIPSFSKEKFWNINMGNIAFLRLNILLDNCKVELNNVFVTWVGEFSFVYNTSILLYY